MKKLKTALLATLLAGLSGAANAALTAHFVAPFHDSAPGSPYDSATISLELDPASTVWIGWNGRADLNDAGTPPGMFTGSTDDYIDITITDTKGHSASFSLDQNDSNGAPVGTQNVIFGLAADAPDVWRNDPRDPLSPQTLDEAGPFNAFFSGLGKDVYTFRFDFMNVWGNGAHGDVYLLTETTVPEPETAGLALGALGGLALAGRYRRKRG